MRPSSPSTEADDRGSAALEFIVVGLLLLVPVIYLVVALGVIQGRSLGAEAGARHVARAVATAADAGDAAARAERVIDSVAAEYGFEPDAVSIALACTPAGAACPSAGTMLTVTARATVTLPLVPPILGLDRLASVPIEATAVQKVSRTWGAR